MYDNNKETEVFFQTSVMLKYNIHADSSGSKAPRYKVQGW